MASLSLRHIRQISWTELFNALGLVVFTPLTTVGWMIIPTLSQAHLSWECSAYLVTMYSNFSGKEKLRKEGKNKLTTSPSTSARCAKKIVRTNNQPTEVGCDQPADSRFEAEHQTQRPSRAPGVAYSGSGHRHAHG